MKELADKLYTRVVQYCAMMGVLQALVYLSGAKKTITANDIVWVIMLGVGFGVGHTVLDVISDKTQL